MKRYIYSAEDLDYKPRMQLAKTTTNPHELLRLADDESEYVRYWVAENPNTPVEVLAQLANDEDEDVKRAARSNYTYLYAPSSAEEHANRFREFVSKYNRNLI